MKADAGRRRVGGAGFASLFALAARAPRMGARPGLRMDDPDAFARVTTLGDQLEQAQATGHPLHIVYVHGIRAYGAGEAQVFMRGLVRHGRVEGPPVDAGGQYQRSDRFWTELGRFPAEATVMGQRVFPCELAWLRSRPFVDRYLFRREGRVLAVLDEVNWWPLLFPFKCRFLVGPDAALSGADRKDIAACEQDDDTHFPWLTPQDAKAAARGRRISGGGAAANTFVKDALFIWGLSDAVVALGDVSSLLREAMGQAFDYAAGFEGRDLAAQQFAVVAESLGAFVVLDAAAAGGEAARVADGIGDVWLFANQFPLLELARVEGLHATSPHGRGLLHRWAAAPRTGHAQLRPRQVIAFSDPSDALTYLVPKLPAAPGEPEPIVVNIFDRNEFDWFHLAADPISAHTGHPRNEAVLRLMLTPNRKV